MIGRAVVSDRMHKARLTFIGDATRLWNKVPTSITKADTLGQAKKEI